MHTLGLAREYEHPTPGMGFGGFGWDCRQFITPNISSKERWSKKEIREATKRLNSLAYQRLYWPEYVFESGEH